MRIHTDEKPFKCKICDRQFSHNKSLQNHKRIHTGEKPYTCNICDQQFSRSCSLQVHKRIHTGEKPYNCELCSKSYKQYEALKIHQRAEHNKPKIKCTWVGCDREFVKNSHRTEHIKARHDSTPYHCDQCDRKYAFKKELNHHKRKHEIMKTRKLLQK